MVSEEKPVRLYLDPAVHARLRVQAAEAGLPMSAYVRQLVERAVRERDERSAPEGKPAGKKGGKA